MTTWQRRRRIRVGAQPFGARILAFALCLVIAVGCGGRAWAVPEPDPVGVWPLSPTPSVVAGFNPPSSPWGAGHRGVDLLASSGAQVVAALAGTVTFAGPLAGRPVVVVNHGDTRTTYEPVVASVAAGAVVAAGHPIGTLTGVGSHCLPRTCLHWGWLRGETYLDPLSLIDGGPMRLLPLFVDEPVSRSPMRHPATSMADPRVAWWRSGAGMGLAVGAP